MTRTFLRIFLKPAGEKWYDLPLAQNQTIQMWFAAVRTEGVTIHDTFMVPWDSIHSVATWQIADSGEVVKFSPIDGGKAS